jgi:hypothetical protein
MKITEKQILQLIILLHSSLTKNVIGYLCISHEDRQKLLNDIVAQQSEDIIKINKEQ